MKRKWLWFLAVILLCTACGKAPQEQTGSQQASETEQVDTELETESETETEGVSGSQTSEDTQTQEDTQAEQGSETVPEPEVVEIVVSAVGDCTLGTNQKQKYNSYSFHYYYDQKGDEYFLKNVKHIFEEDDFTIVNLEGTLTNSDNIRASKTWNHKGRPEYVNILTKASVEAVTLGNNHIMDYQEDGVADTIATVKDAGLEYALSGDWGNHYGLYETEQGIKIGFVSVNEYYDGKRCYNWLEKGLNKLREKGADIVIAATHWGGDKTHELEDAQKDMGKWCIDLGYDLVLGCHPHVLQGIEEYKGKFIVYSMGNFCYGGNKNPPEKESMIFQTTFTFVDGVLQPQTEGKVIPCQLSSVTSKNDYSPIVLEGDKAQQVINNLNQYSEGLNTVIEDDGTVRAIEETE